MLYCRCNGNTPNISSNKVFVIYHGFLFPTKVVYAKLLGLEPICIVFLQLQSHKFHKLFNYKNSPKLLQKFAVVDLSLIKPFRNNNL